MAQPLSAAAVTTAEAKVEESEFMLILLAD
jgi:hypothetical protein